MPCMPARRELHTGRYNFLHRSWGPLEPFDDSLPELLKDNGVYAHLVSDHQHYWEDGGATYHTRYNSWEFSRGQEGDHWKGHIVEPDHPDMLRSWDNDNIRHDWVNREYMQQESDQPQAQTFANGMDFIRKNHAEENWFLQIETFDPHEPFFTQQHYKDLYPHDYDGPHFDWPPYARVTETLEQVEHARYEYAALVSMCDYYLGQVMGLMDTLKLWDDTLLIVCTDHGYMLGEHDWWAKIYQPLYDEIIHTPLFVWDPRCGIRGERRQSLVQTIDFMPTLLDFFGIDIPPDVQGAALAETIADDQPVREAALFGYHGGHVNVTDGRYVYMRAPQNEENTPLFEYTLMPTHMRSHFSVAELQDITLAEPFSFTKGCRTMKMPGRAWMKAHQFGSLLFDLQEDPDQLTPAVAPKIEQQLMELMIDLMKWNDTPVEQFQRLGLPTV